MTTLMGWTTDRWGNEFTNADDVPDDFVPPEDWVPVFVEELATPKVRRLAVLRGSRWAEVSGAPWRETRA